MRQEPLALYVLSQILSFEHVSLTLWEKLFIYAMFQTQMSHVFQPVLTGTVNICLFQLAVNRNWTSDSKQQANVNKT